MRGGAHFLLAAAGADFAPPSADATALAADWAASEPDAATTMASSGPNAARVLRLIGISSAHSPTSAGPISPAGPPPRFRAWRDAAEARLPRNAITAHVLHGRKDHADTSAVLRSCVPGGVGCRCRIDSQRMWRQQPGGGTHRPGFLHRSDGN